MKRPRCRGRWLGLGLALAAPGLAWALALALIPTGWARDRLAARLAEATGRSVRIGAVRIGCLGRLRLVDLAIAEPASPADPWLRAAGASVDLHLGQVLLGCSAVTEVAVDGLSLRVWRRKDGSFELGDLIEPPRPAGRGPSGGATAPATTAVTPVRVTIRCGSVRYLDEPGGLRVDLANVEARATGDGRSATLEEFRGALNGGSLAMAGRIERDRIAPRFEAEIRADGVAVDRGLRALDEFIPVLGGRAGGDAAVAGGGPGGRLRLRLAVKGQGATRAEVRRSVEGHGSVRLDPVDLDGSRFLAELESLGEWPAKGRVGSVGADFRVERGRFATDNLTLLVSRLPFVLGGWVDFDGRFDLSCRGDRTAEALPEVARQWLRESRGDGAEGLSGLRLRGDRDRVDVTLRGRPLAGDPARPEAERARVRQVAREIRDRFFQ